MSDDGVWVDKARVGEKTRLAVVRCGALECLHCHLPMVPMVRHSRWGGEPDMLELFRLLREGHLTPIAEGPWPCPNCERAWGLSGRPGDRFLAHLMIPSDRPAIGVEETLESIRDPTCVAITRAALERTGIPEEEWHL